MNYVEELHLIVNLGNFFLLTLYVFSRQANKEGDASSSASPHKVQLHYFLLKLHSIYLVLFLLIINPFDSSVFCQIFNLVLIPFLMSSARTISYANNISHANNISSTRTISYYQTTYIHVKSWQLPSNINELLIVVSESIKPPLI